MSNTSIPSGMTAMPNVTIDPYSDQAMEALGKAIIGPNLGLAPGSTFLG